MQDKKNKIVFWVEKIALKDIMLFLIQSCFVDIRVNYDRFQKYPLATKAFYFLDRVRLNSIFFPVELTLDKTDAEGYALNYRVEKELNNCIEDFFIKHIPQESKRFKNMLKSYMGAVLKDKVVFITMVSSEVTPEKASTDEDNVIYLNAHPLNHLLRGFYRGREFVLGGPVISMRNVTFYFRPFCYLALILLCKLGNSKVKSNISNIKPAIWVEYFPGRMHAFWMGAIKSQGFDIVNYLDRGDTQVTSEAIEEIESRNSKWIDAHFLSLIRMSRLNFSAFTGLLSELSLIFFSKPVWLKVFRFEYAFFSRIYESVFLRYKVRILIQHQECSWRQEAQALAVERAGGIMVGYHWSVYPYRLMSVEFFPQHVYFAWGKMMGELLVSKDNVRRYVLPSGIWIVPDGKNDGGNNIFAENVNFVISVFDSSVGYNLFQSPNSLSEFYLRVLDIVEKSPGFGCIIKSKGPLHQVLLSLPSGKAIMEKVEKLKGQNRLAVFDFNDYPLAAAAHSNLSVGYSINSACTVASIMCNRNGINWDCSGLKRHSFYKYPDQKIVFKTLDELEEAILKASRGDKTIGDHSCCKKDINYFEDSMAVNRIANFLESYMKESIDTADPEHSLDFAVKKYLGDNKVGEDFYQKGDLWGDE